MQQKKTRRGREYLNDFRRDVNGSYLYQGSYRRYTGSMPYAKLRGLLWALCGGALAALAAAGMVPAPGAMQQFYVLLPYAGGAGGWHQRGVGAGPHEPRRGTPAQLCV